MVITQDTVNNYMTFAGDNAGWGWARIPLVVPSGAKRLDFVYRAWWNLGETTNYTGRVWNHMNCLGLLLNAADVPELPAGRVTYGYAPPRFFGWNSTSWMTNGTLADQSAISSYHNSGPNRMILGGGDGSGKVRKSGISNGNGTVLGEDYFSHASVYTQNASLPYGNTQGAVECRGFRIYADQATKTMGGFIGLNSQSLTGDNMYNVFTAPDSGMSANFQIHGDVVSDYRPDLATVVLPAYLIIRCSHPTLTLTFKEARYRFYDFNNNPL